MVYMWKSSKVLGANIFLTKQFFCSTSPRNMPKKPKIKEGKSSKDSKVDKPTAKGPLKTNPEGSILMEIYAKPGAKQNCIVEVTEEGINVQINAPPVEGSANTELVKYMASFLGLKSSHVTLERGHKSRNKVLKISGGISKAAIVEKLNAELPDGSRLTED
ncbi:UPF0235 protein C15orf40 homolog [Anthonomus grandis grandis]|uniref:UPF0235 protein C15orf40 homolog n=1 Tax=Anthonomus grandis grandis TaxID=2921223 RepID=UPI0021652214|nr:UPF0235 protein C15orf40 homolog [Anthonomus grandis grandis]